MEHITECL